METFEASKHRPLPRDHFHSSTAYFRMDAQRNPDGVRQATPRGGQTYTCKRSPLVLDDAFNPLVSCVMSPTASTISTPATWFMEISREYAIGLKPVSPPY